MSFLNLVLFTKIFVNMLRSLLVVILFFSLFTILSAQNCGIDAYHQECMQKDALYKEGYLKNEYALKEITKNRSNNRSRSQAGPYVLPMVIHILHLGENTESNTYLSDDDIREAIERLNYDFAGNRHASAVDTEIEFCLATFDPQGNPTNGIIRTDASHIPDYAELGVRWGNSTGIDDVLVKDLSRWPVEDYLNVWVVHRINGAGAYATYPNGGKYDGSTMTIYNLNSGVFAHEVGHNMYLFHTFNGDSDGTRCPSDVDCANEGDRVCDTPAHKRSDCNFGTECNDDPNFKNSELNFMSYCGDYDLFTEGQKNRMHDVLAAPIRRQLLNSLGCLSNLPSNNVAIKEIQEFDLTFCQDNYYPIIEVVNKGQNQLLFFGVKYRIDNGPIQNMTVNCDLAYGETGTFTLDPITVSNGIQKIYIEVLSPNGQVDELPEFDELAMEFVFDNDLTLISPNYFEDFESYYDLDFDLLPSGYNTYAKGGQSFSSWDDVRNGENVWMSARAYGVTNEEVIDILALPLFDLSEHTNARFSFKYSFGHYSETNFDDFSAQLVVFEACNQSGDVVWKEEAESLLTFPTGNAINAIDSYKAIEVDLSDYDGEVIRIEFQYLYIGNDSYVGINFDNPLLLADYNGEPATCQIPISLNMLFNEDGTNANANNGPASLFDEQETVIEPPYGNGARVEIPWTTPYVADQVVYLDLGKEYNIFDIYYYDTFGAGNFKIKPTLPTVASNEEITFNVNAWPVQWKALSDLNWQTRYISFTKSDVGASIGEIYICGSPVDGTQASCSDGIQNQNETGIDCGGICAPCDNGGGECEEDLEGYEFLGSFEGNNYFISNALSNWTTADNLCKQNGGELLSVNSAAENEFIRSKIENNFVLIGINDSETEGTLKWSDGSPLTYTNYFGANTASKDYGMMNFWDGSWSFIESNVGKLHILEMTCENETGDGIVLNCPSDFEILLPYLETTGQIIYDVNATTDCTLGVVDIDIDGIGSGGTGIFGSYPINVTATDACGNSASCSFVVTLKTREHNSEAICPADITVTAADEQGAIVTWEEPSYTTDCEGLSLTYQGFYQSGDLIPIGTHQIDYAWNADGPLAICGYGVACNFTVTVLPPDQGGECPDDVAGYEVLGEFGNSKYFLSNAKMNWQDAQLEVAVNTEGYLVSINSAEENEFLRSAIGNELVIIGLSDRRQEDDLVWDSGEPLIYNNLEVTNTHAGDNGYMNFWNGAWGLDSPWTSRKFILEVPCDENQSGINLNCPSDIVINLTEGETSGFVEYMVDGSTTCDQEGFLLSLTGPFSGSNLVPGEYEVSVEATDYCGNVENCTFGITINAPDNSPKPDMVLSNFSYNTPGVYQGEVLFFETDVTNQGNLASGAFTIKSYISVDQNLSEDDVQDGNINTSFFAPGQTVSDVTGALTIPESLQAGDYYIILKVDADDQLEESNENNNVLVASETFAVLSTTSGCEETFPNATYIGEQSSGLSKYFISNEKYTWLEGQTFATANGGNLATINDLSENQFILNQLDNDLVFIGVHDSSIEGDFVWSDGQSYSFNNFSGGNSASNDFGYMNFWDGTWGLDGQWTRRKLLIEVPCLATGLALDDFVSSQSAISLQSNADGLSLLRLYPNPTNSDLNVLLENKSSAELTMMIYDINGSLKYERKVQAKASKEIINLNLENLQPGVYHLIVKDKEGKLQQKRFVKM